MSLDELILIFFMILPQFFMIIEPHRFCFVEAVEKTDTKVTGGSSGRGGVTRKIVEEKVSHCIL